MSILNGNLKSNGKVGPMKEDTVKEFNEQLANNTPITIANDPIEPTPEVLKRSFINRLFKKEKKENESEIKKKPAGPKLKTFEIVCITFK